MSQNNSFDEINSKMRQLQLDFSKIPASNPCDFPPLKYINKLYLPWDFGKHPFFVATNSKVSLNSRKGYKAFRVNRKMEKNGFSATEIAEATQFTSSPSFLSYKTSSGWEILAHSNYGFPDALDGYVFEFILCLIAALYKAHKKFFIIYHFNFSELIAFLVSKGCYKTVNGNFYERVRDAIYRLKHTSYMSKDGLFVKATASYTSSYTFSLITSVYEKGALLEDGTVVGSYAVAIDPLLIHNFSQNYYLIALNDFRSTLKDYSSVMLLDRLTYLAFNGIKGTDFSYAYKNKLPLWAFVTYPKLCEFVGFKQLKGQHLYPSKIAKQFEPFTAELIKLGCIKELFIDFTNVTSIRMVFWLDNDFVINLVKLLNQAKFNDWHSYQKTAFDQKRYFSKVRTHIKDPDIIKKLFPLNIDETMESIGD